jgi:hypothetical protein
MDGFQALSQSFTQRQKEAGKIILSANVFHIEPRLTASAFALRLNLCTRSQFGALALVS